MADQPLPDQERLVGIISGKLDSKYFGFIAVKGHAKDYFFHASGLKGVEFEELCPGDRVSFLIVDTEKGPRAVGVEKVF